NAPGTMTVRGNLAFQSGALYVVQVNPTTASLANVTTSGAATLAGTARTVFAPGSYLTKNYTILHADGGRSGTFGSFTTTNLPAGFTANLSYTATDAVLNLTAALGTTPAPTPGLQPLTTSSLSSNQQSIATSLNNFFNGGGALPPGFVSVFGLTGGNLGTALDRLSGEVATGGQRVGAQIMNEFLGLMLDPYVEGRSGIGGAGGPALGFA